MRAAVFSFSLRGAQLSHRVSAYLQSIGYEVTNQTVAKYAEASGLTPMLPDHKAACEQAFRTCQTIVFIGAVGIAVRTIAPHIVKKTTDPAVISMDERGMFIIPLLSGHIGGANEMARCLAGYLGETSTACVTTATDVNGLFAVDEWAARNHMTLEDLSAAKDFAAALVAGQDVGVSLDSNITLEDNLPPHMILVSQNAESKCDVGMVVTTDIAKHPFNTTIKLLPKIVHLGIGCKRNTPIEKIEALVLPRLQELHIDWRSVADLSSVDLKKDEQGLLAFAKKYNIAANFYTADELNAVEGDFPASSFVQSIVGVNNVCERSAVKASNNGKVILHKTSLNGVTLAIAVENLKIHLQKTGLRTE